MTFPCPRQIKINVHTASKPNQVAVIFSPASERFHYRPTKPGPLRAPLSD